MVMDNLSYSFHPDALWVALLSFLEQGGAILSVIMLTTFGLWMLILERHYYFWKLHNNDCRKVLVTWSEQSDKYAWSAIKIRSQLLSIVRIKSECNLSTINLIVVIAPLLGLLGTVTGMMDVFDVMASTGSSNSRGMAAGVSKATIPTMAGMVVSLSGVLFSVSLKKKASACVDILAHKLVGERVGGGL